MNNLTSLADIAAQVEAKRYNEFTFPVLGITIKYRKPDVLQLALNKSLPGVMADAVIKAYKANFEGRGEEFQAEMKAEKISADDKLLTELRQSGYTLLGTLCDNLKIMDVPKSDVENSVLCWNDIPEEDAIAFVLTLINRANTSATNTGGEVSGEEIVTFPDNKRVPKRNSARKNGQDVRPVPSA